jgi:hypothetical protein
MKLTKVKLGWTAYVLDEASRNKLLAAFPPKYPDVIAHHVTLAHPSECPEPSELGKSVSIKVIGHIEDDSLETLVVEVNGKVGRPDGKVFHITWSLDRSKGRKPVESNALIARAGFKPVSPVTVTGHLQFFGANQ